MKIHLNICLLICTCILYSCAKFNSQQLSNLDLQKNEKSQSSENIDRYFLNLIDWSELSPLKPDAKVQQSLKTTNEFLLTEKGQQPVSCISESIDLTKTPEKIVMQNPAAGVLYPGALIQGQGFLQGPGGLRELTIRKRAPMTVVSDLASENNSVEMQTVNYATFQNAYAKLLKTSLASGVMAPANIYFNQVEAQKSEQAALDLGFSVKYLGASLAGDLDSKNSTSENVFMAVFEQRAFTMSVVAPSSPSGYFSLDLILEDLKKQEMLGNLGKLNPPLYVSSVSYGRMLIFTISSKASKSEIQAALKGIYKNVLFKSDLALQDKYKKIINESKIKVISFGGESDQAIQLIKTGQLNEYFNQSPKLDSFVPLSYVIRNIKDNSIAKISETTRYSTQECSALPVKSWKVRLSFEKIKAYDTSDFNGGEIYGALKVNAHDFWFHTKNDFIKMKNGAEFHFPENHNSIEISLSLEKPNPIRLQGDILDNDCGILGCQLDDRLVSFNDQLGYHLDGRIVEDGTYSIRRKDVGDFEIFYSIKKIQPEY